MNGTLPAGKTVRSSLHWMSVSQHIMVQNCQNSRYHPPPGCVYVRSLVRGILPTAVLPGDSGSHTLEGVVASPHLCILPLQALHMKLACRIHLQSYAVQSNHALVCPRRIYPCSAGATSGLHCPRR